jgi:hypothetical protein
MQDSGIPTPNDGTPAFVIEAMAELVDAELEWQIAAVNRVAVEQPDPAVAMWAANRLLIRAERIRDDWDQLATVFFCLRDANAGIRCDERSAAWKGIAGATNDAVYRLVDTVKQLRFEDPSCVSCGQPLSDNDEVEVIADPAGVLVCHADPEDCAL